MPIREGLDSESLTITTLGVGVAVLASVARAIRKKTTVWRILSRISSSAIAAFVIGTAVLELTSISAQGVLAVCGVAGWAGGEIMDVLADILEQHIKKRGEPT
jgi:hypothetical protein